MYWSKETTSRSIIQAKFINKVVIKYIEGYKHLYTARDVSDHLYQIYGIKVSALLLQRILNEQLGMSFKLGKFRPVGFEEDKVSLMKGLFSIKISRMINKHDALININESMFSRTTKTNYSWSERGK